MEAETFAAVILALSAIASIVGCVVAIIAAINRRRPREWATPPFNQANMAPDHIDGSDLARGQQPQEDPPQLVQAAAAQAHGYAGTAGDHEIP